MANLKLRSGKRYKTRLKAQVHHDDIIFEGWVMDLSREGICIRLRETVTLRIGATINIQTKEMGMLTGNICWTREDHLGAKLKLNSNDTAKVESYYRLFADKYDPLIRKAYAS